MVVVVVVVVAVVVVVVVVVVVAALVILVPEVIYALNLPPGLAQSTRRLPLGPPPACL